MTIKEFNRKDKQLSRERRELQQELGYHIDNADRCRDRLRQIEAEILEMNATVLE